MTDNVDITPGTGKTVLADEVTEGTLGTGVVQFVKLMDGTIDGTEKAKILAANTAPSTGDAALVVAISPNGEVAHDAVDSGAGAKIAAKAIAGINTITAVSAADRTDLYAGTDGVLLNRPHCGLEDIVSASTLVSSSTVAVTLLSSVASMKQYITHLSFVNTSTQNTMLGLIDGTTPAVAYYPCPANYSGMVMNLTVPLPPASAGTKWQVQSDSSLAVVRVNAIGFKSKV